MIALPDLAATTAAGARLAQALAGGDAIALVGELGAGKTAFTAGVVAALGAGDAASPTFALVHEYRGGRLVVWHLDLYRLERAAELVELGLDDMIDDPRGVVLIEWADKFADEVAVMPPDHLRLELAHDGDGRTLTATGTGPRGRALAAVLALPA